jgi:hypothetical protein
LGHPKIVCLKKEGLFALAVTHEHPRALRHASVV